MPNQTTTSTARSAAPTIAVLGAGGRLGSTIAHEAASRGHHVIAVTRSGTVPDEIGQGIGMVAGRAADARDTDALTQAVSGADVVVNALNPPYTEWRENALPMARNVIDACAAAGAHHLFPGNVYAYGRSMPSVITADTPERPTSRKGAIRRDMEAMFRRSADAGRARTTIVRAGDFFGGARPAGAWFDLVIASKLAKGRFTYPGPLNLPHAWAYLPDLARVFVDLAEQRGALPDFAVLGFEGHTLTGSQMKATLEAVTGRTLKTTGLPWPIIRAMGLLHPMSREIAEMAYLWSTPHRIDGTALVQIIGEAPQTPINNAVEHALTG